jgi:hypothetical protein
MQRFVILLIMWPVTDLVVDELFVCLAVSGSEIKSKNLENTSS